MTDRCPACDGQGKRPSTPEAEPDEYLMCVDSECRVTTFVEVGG